MSSTFYLPDLVDRGYKIVVRINGIASEIYEAFIKCEKSLIKKAYSFNEARLIRKWEEKISEHATIVTTTIGDKQKFQQLYKGAQTRYIAPFIPMPEIKCQPGTGMYCLYYGDLSNPENEKMVSWLSDNVFNKMPVPLIVADTGSSVKPRDPLNPDSNICVVSNPATAELNELIQKAQIILLLRCHNHGFDNRLPQALGKGRYCICNDLMIHDTGLEKLFIVANEEDEIIYAINSYFCRPFTDKNINERTHILSTSYFPRQSLNELLEMIEQ
jgi:hypothetical protein